MSFDIKAINGDIELGPNGDVVRVVDSDKLAQDVIKLLNTTLESDPLNPGYGSLLTNAMIGSGNKEPQSLAAQAQVIIADALDQLIAQQQFQKTFQALTDAETIIDFNTPLVEQDPQEPRQFNIQVDAVSRDLTPITLAFVIRV